MDVYGIHDVEYSKNCFKGMLSQYIAINSRWGMREQEPETSDYIKGYTEMARLMDFLRACGGKELHISGTISNPQGNEKKGCVRDIYISSQYFKDMLESFVHTLFEKSQEGLFQCEFDWEWKKPIKHMWKTTVDGKEVEVEEEDPFFTEPFSCEEIKKINDYFDEKEKKQFRTINGKKGRIVNRIKKSVSQYVTDMNTTKLYSFIYDVMLTAGITSKDGYIGEGFSGDIGREKSQHIRNWLKAYEKERERLRGQK
jgi:hypothetical protein